MIEKILHIISNAAKQIDGKFLQLTTTYEPSGIVRERVFCYELYHKIRCEVGDNYPLTLNGEIDKRGHHDFAIKDRKNPDFVLHIPGEHEGNTIIIEVKGKLDRNGIIKDLKTLKTFVSKYQYKAGIFLLYNHSLQELKNIVGDDLFSFIYSKFADRIYIITLPQAHEIEKIIPLITLQDTNGS